MNVYWAQIRRDFYPNENKNPTEARTSAGRGTDKAGDASTPILRKKQANARGKRNGFPV